MPRFAQRAHGDGRDIAFVNGRRDSSGAGPAYDIARTDLRRPPPQRICRERAGPQESPLDARRFSQPLDPRVQRRNRIRLFFDAIPNSQIREEDDALERRPNENLGLGRIFRVKERAQLNVRIEFTDIFNRAVPPNPTSTNALAAQTTNKATGATTAGFGFINTSAVGAVSAVGTATSRQGTIVARLTF